MQFKGLTKTRPAFPTGSPIPIYSASEFFQGHNLFRYSYTGYKLVQNLYRLSRVQKSFRRCLYTVRSLVFYYHSKHEKRMLYNHAQKREKINFHEAVNSPILTVILLAPTRFGKHFYRESCSFFRIPGYILRVLERVWLCCCLVKDDKTLENLYTTQSGIR